MDDALLAVIAPIVAAAPVEWRRGHGWIVYTALFLVVLVAVVAALSGRLSVKLGRAAWGVVTLVGVLALAVPQGHSSPYSFDNIHAAYTNADRVASVRSMDARLDVLRDHIGAGTRVTYLAFGDVDYVLGNPTTCRYPVTGVPPANHLPVGSRPADQLPGESRLPGRRFPLPDRATIVVPDRRRVPADPSCCERAL